MEPKRHDGPSPELAKHIDRLRREAIAEEGRKHAARRARSRLLALRIEVEEEAVPMIVGIRGSHQTGAEHADIRVSFLAALDTLIQDLEWTEKTGRWAR